MKIILLIIAIIYLLNTIRLRNIYVNEHLGIDGNIGNFLGTFLASTVEGICWWYIINTIIMYF